MGFFTSIKKFWKGEEEAQSPDLAKEAAKPVEPLEEELSSEDLPEPVESAAEEIAAPGQAGNAAIVESLKPERAEEPAETESAKPEQIEETAAEEIAGPEPVEEVVAVEPAMPDRIEEIAEEDAALEADAVEDVSVEEPAEPEEVVEPEDSVAEELESAAASEVHAESEAPAAEPEASVAEPEPSVSPGEAAVAESEAFAAEPEVPAAEPEVPAAEPEPPVVPAEAPAAPVEAPRPKEASTGFFAGLKKLWSKDDSAAAKPAAPSAAPEVSTGIDERLTLALREAEPRLSVWLGIVLEGVDEAGDLLWARLAYLLRALETPDAEAAQFIDEFKTWLKRMDYVYVQEFRSELQYRLALALELEDEEDEKNRLLLKLSSGLSRTREQISRGLDAVFSSHGALDAAFWEELEEIFIMADMGPEAAMLMVKNLKERAQKEGVSSPEDVRGLLKAELGAIFQGKKRISAVNPPEVVLMVGVNGVGKTTTIAKLAHRARMQGKKVLIAAGDTFRAAAVEQMGIWAERVGAGFHCRDHGADPAAVAYEAMDIALRDGYDLLFVDTAGRLHTKVNLMEELAKIRNVLGKKHPGAPHRTILVIDATTGQNALSQTKMFREAAKVDEIILTKLDGTAKGGVAIAVTMQYDAPITYIGLGEKLEDLRPFNGEDFAAALLEGHGASKGPGLDK